MRAQISSVFALLTTIGASITAFAQAARPAQPAPNPNAPAPAAAAPATQPGQAMPGAAANGNGSTIALRDAPRGDNPVLAAFTPRSGGLTSNEVAARAVATSDTIAAKNAELRAAAAAVDSAMYQFYPKVALKASYTRFSPVSVSLGPYSFVMTTGQGGVTTNANTVVGSDGKAAIAAPLSIPIPNNYYSLGATLGVPISDYVLRLARQY